MLRHCEVYTGCVYRPCWTNSFFPLSAISKKQSCVPHSTPEAEIVAADLAIRTEGLPALQLWDMVLERPMKLVFQENNQATIQILKIQRTQHYESYSQSQRLVAL